MKGRYDIVNSLSWVRDISRDCRDSRMVMRFIEFLLQPEEMLMMADANNTLLANRHALHFSERYKSDDTPLFDVERLSTSLSRTQFYSSASPQLQHRFDTLIKAIAAGHVA